MTNEETKSNENTTATSPVDPTTLFWTWEAGKVITHPRSEFQRLEDHELVTTGMGLISFLAGTTTPYDSSEPATLYEFSSMSQTSMASGLATAADYKRPVLGMYHHIYRPLTPAARDFVARCF